VTTLTFSEAEQRTGRMLAQLAERVDAFERHRPGHAMRVALLSERLARRVGMAEIDIADVKSAAVAHGFGLYSLRLGALERAGPLTLAERIELWRHPLLAEQQLAKRGLSRHAQLVVRWHHEWWNGLGYPDMLVGEAIPVGARIIRIVESYEALRSDRPYRSALDPDVARGVIADQSGLELDPSLAAQFLALLEEDPDMHARAVEPDRPPRLRPILAEPRPPEAGVSQMSPEGERVAAAPDPEAGP
jgi:HD-GYP domain-containing protein (c-di-GMP phosphodiesterase class II)